jgi:hypothetical protein
MSSLPPPGALVKLSAEVVFWRGSEETVCVLSPGTPALVLEQILARGGRRRRSLRVLAGGEVTEVYEGEIAL